VLKTEPVLQWMDNIRVRRADLARLALCTEVAVARRQLTDDTKQSSIALVRWTPTVFHGRLEVHHSQLQDVNKVCRVEALEVWVALQLGEVACSHVIDALRQQLVQAVRLCRHQQLHAARLCQQELLTLLLHLRYLVLFSQWQQLMDICIWIR